MPVMLFLLHFAAEFLQSARDRFDLFRVVDMFGFPFFALVVDDLGRGDGVRSGSQKIGGKEACRNGDQNGCKKTMHG